VHCTHIAGSANVKVQNIFNGRSNITCSRNCKYSTAATPYTQKHGLFQVYNCKYPAYGDTKDVGDDDDDDDNLSSRNMIAK
jgi:hypothetical protein